MNEFIDSESSTLLLQTIDDKTETAAMGHHEHERTSQHTSFFYRFSNFSSSSSMSPRFLGLCFLVFIYYIGYGYLQVCYLIKNKYFTLFIYLGTYVYITWF